MSNELKPSRGRLGLGLLLLLGACAPKPDPIICSTPLNVLQIKDAPAIVKAESCVHRWSYRLGGTTENADSVAEAVVAGCREAITPLARETLENAETVRSTWSDREIGASYAEVEHWQRIAKFYVLQGRAGRCRAD